MNFNELENYLSSLPDKILDDAAEIVAETATSYYKERFREKVIIRSVSARRLSTGIRGRRQRFRAGTGRS